MMAKPARTICFGLTHSTTSASIGQINISNAMPVLSAGVSSPPKLIIETMTTENKQNLYAYSLCNFQKTKVRTNNTVANRTADEPPVFVFGFPNIEYKFTKPKLIKTAVVRIRTELKRAMNEAMRETKWILCVIGATKFIAFLSFDNNVDCLNLFLST